MTPELENKYAHLWHETNAWKVPKGLEPFNRHGDIDSYRDKELYVSGLWKILNMMAKDGLITQKTLRRIHEEQPSMKNQKSRITII